MVVFRSLSKPGHDYGKFGTGNKQTLMTDPRKKGIEPREALLKFHKEYYSSDIMTFAVLGRESLDELERMVVELDFGCIEAKGITRKVWDDSPYSSSCLMKKIEIVPVKDLRQLTLAFPIPDYTDEYRTQPAHYVSHLLGHEGPGSLLSALKRQGWVSSLTAGGRVLARGFGVFNISVDLSEEGLKHIPDIIELAFCSIGVINSAQPLKWVHEELRQLADMKFRFKDKEVPINYVTHLSSDLQRIPFENILNSEYQMDVFKPDLISELLGMLTPQKLMYFAVSQDYAGRPGNVNEKWYGTEYQQFPLDERFLEKCSTALKCGGHDSLHIPSKNEYIATKFDLKPREKEDSDVPKLIKDDTWVRLWFMQDREFLLPKANIKLAIHSPFMSSNPFNAFLSTMYVVCFQDALAEETYNPFLAGLSGSVEIHAAGLFISISGYDEKQKLLLKHLVHRLVNFVPESHRFEVLKEVLCRNLRNFRQNQPYLQSHYFAGMILIEKHWSKEELLACAEECTLEKLKAFISDALRAFYVEGLVFGNVTEDESLSLVKEAVSELRTVPGSRPLFPSEISLNRVHELPAGSAHIFKEFQETHPNAAVDFILQTGVQSSLANVLLELIVQIAAEPAFNQLRTNEQLGYIVHTGVRRAHGTQSIEFIIQGQNDPEFMQDRIENFLRILRQRVESMSDQEFHDNIEAVAVKRLEKPKTMGAKASRFWSEIELGYYHFNRENVEVPELRRIKKSEVLSYFDTYLMVDSPQRRKLCTMVYANTQTAEEVEKNEIHTRVKRGASGDIVTRGKDLRIDDIHAFKSQLSLYPLPQPVLEIPPLASCNARRPS
ncbi:hypothetical protein AB6A40_002946 [Gnathostoma spinigerum]|uniref:Insulin-degrading enzyme n=1 Tax=Gnathostoma spinigerum TaxID=75299 RepID=A0ABD6EI38_9BILA